MMSASYLRYAPHLGYLSPEQPLFRESVGSLDPVDHVRFAAEQGFAGIFDPWMDSRPAGEIERLLSAVRDHDLESGGITYASFATMFTPLFARDGRTAWAEIEQHFDRTVPLATRVGAKTIAIVLQGTRELSWPAQHKAAAEHLRRAGDRAAAAGLVIGVEHMVALPDLMLSTTEAAVDFLRGIDHQAVQLIFDTGHVQDMDGNIHAAWQLARDHVCVLQLADMPGRVEPGGGTLDLVRFLVTAVRDGKAGGLIELEHGWTAASVEGERLGIDALRDIDEAVRRRVEIAEGDSNVAACDGGAGDE